MQRFLSSYRILALPVVLSILMAGLVSCGGGGSSSNTNTNTLTISPTSVSVSFGDVVPIAATIKDSSGNLITTGTVTWTSSSPTLASVTADGRACGGTTTQTTCVCGGQWQNSNVDCIAPSSGGTATITATASGLTATATVFVHPKVARVEITTPVSSDCTSSTGTQQLSAQAYDSNGNPVTVGADATAFTWTTSDASIATVNTNGLATAVNPGKGNLYAAVGNVSSPPYPFTTCGVKSISLHLSGATDTSFTVASGTGKTLAADIVDTKGNSITVTNSRLTWSSSMNGVASVDQNGNVATPGVGTSGIVVSCSPSLCNSGLTSVFSNLVTATSTGTPAAQVLAASSSGTSLIPIDTTTNTAGTAVTLPYTPNSLIYANNAAIAFLGSPTSLMSYDPSLGTVTTYPNLPGIVQAVSNNGQYVVIYNPVTSIVSVYNVTSSTVQDSFVVGGIPNPCKTATSDQCPHASFTPDNRTTYIVAGTNLYVSNANASLKTIPLGATGQDVAVSAQGSFAFVANGNSTVVPYATCDNSRVSSNVNNTTGPVLRIKSTVDATKIYGIAPPSLNIVSPTTDATGCVPSLTDPLTSVDLGQGTFTPQHMLISTDGNRVYFLTGSNNIVVYDAASNTSSAIALAAGANALSGGLTADGNTLYVGGSDNTIHRIDTTTNTDAQQITVSFTPDLVAVRPK